MQPFCIKHMYMRIKALLFSSLLSGALSTNAQIAPKWEVNLENDIDWHSITNQGIILAGSAKSLYTIDPETGKTYAQLTELAGLTSTDIEELEGSLLLLAKSGGNFMIFDPLSGEIKFNAARDGIAEISFKHYLPAANAIFVAGKDNGGKEKVLVLSNDGGKVLWEKTEKLGRIIAVNETSSSEFILATLFHVYKFNTLTGVQLWKNSTSQAAEQANQLGLGQALQGLAESMAANSSFDIRYLQDARSNVFTLAIETRNEATGSDGKPQVTYQSTFTAFHFTTGKYKWEEAPEYPGKISHVRLTPDGLLLGTDNGGQSRTNLHLFDGNGAGTWGKKGNGLSVRGSVIQSMPVDNGWLLISKSGNSNFIQVVEKESGEYVYKKPVKISGNVAISKSLPSGLLLVSEDEMNVLNLSTGEWLLSKSVSTNPSLVAIRDSEVYFFDTKLQQIGKLSTTDLGVSQLGTEKVKFEGREQPQRLELRDEGVLLFSEQNLTTIGYEGNKVYSIYYPAPRETGLKKALLIAQAARATYIAANAYAASGALQSSAAQTDGAGGVIAQGLGEAYQNLGDQASDFAKQSMQRVLARHKATLENRDHLLLISAQGKDNFLLRVHKSTGEIDAKISLGQDKNPSYNVDEASRLITLITGKRTLSGFQY